MINFLSQYPIVKWILVGFGILYFLDKYLGFSPIDKLINKATKYKFKEFTHLNNTKLKELINLFNQKQFEDLEKMLENFNSSYRSFGFRSLGQYGDVEISDEWINKNDSSVAKIIKSYQLIHLAWQTRGTGYIDTVSKSDFKKFKEYLKEAEALLLSIESKTFQTNISACLLKIYKATDVESRNIIHETYEKGNVLNSNDAELNFSYFSVISQKWGGTEEELKSYLTSLNNKSEFVNNLIYAQYYFDKVRILEDEDANGEIAKFIENSKNYKISDDELYRYEYYLLLYWISNDLNLKSLQNHYKNLVKPYWED